MATLRVLKFSILLLLFSIMSFSVLAQCEDSDGGHERFVKGIVTADEVYEDVCVSYEKDEKGKITSSNLIKGSEGENVIEYFCRDGVVNKPGLGAECPNGCMDGACIESCSNERDLVCAIKDGKSNIYTNRCHAAKDVAKIVNMSECSDFNTCTDTDNSQFHNNYFPVEDDAFTKGTVEIGGETYEDYCVNEPLLGMWRNEVSTTEYISEHKVNKGSTVIEFGCTTGTETKLGVGSEICPKGCVDGKCIKNTGRIVQVTAPDQALIMIKNKNGNEINPVAHHTYDLPDGNYTVFMEHDGYFPSMQAFDIPNYYTKNHKIRRVYPPFIPNRETKLNNGETCGENDGGFEPKEASEVTLRVTDYLISDGDYCFYEVGEHMKPIESCSGADCYLLEAYCKGSNSYGRPVSCTNCQEGSCIGDFEEVKTEQVTPGKHKQGFWKKFVYWFKSLFS